MIDWFAKNPVAANVLMGLILMGGLASLAVIKKEVRPPVTLDQIEITVAQEGRCQMVVEVVAGGDTGRLLAAIKRRVDNIETWPSEADLPIYQERYGDRRWAAVVSVHGPTDGVLFSTLVTLVLVPVGYLIFADIRRLIRRLGKMGLPLAFY